MATERITIFDAFPMGLVNADVDGYSVIGQMGTITVGGVPKLTSKNGVQGNLYKNIGSNYFRAETYVNFATVSRPTNDNKPMVALGVTDAIGNSIKYGIGIYPNGDFCQIVNGIATAITTVTKAPSYLTTTGQTLLAIAAKNGKMYVTFSTPGTPPLGREIVLPSLAGYYLTIQFSGSQYSYDANGFGTGFYLNNITFRDDWSCYSDTTYQKYLYLCPVFPNALPNPDHSDGKDPAWIVIPKNHSLTDTPQRIYIESHGHAHLAYRPIVDYFVQGPMVNSGYASIYVTGRPNCHWGNPETTKQANAARQFLVDNLNFYEKAFCYGSSMGGMFAAGFARDYPQFTGAIAMDVPAVGLDYFYFDKWGYEDISFAYLWNTTSPETGIGDKNRSNQSDPFWTYAWPYCPTNPDNTSKFIGVPALVSCGSTDGIADPQFNGGLWATQVNNAGGNVTYRLENKGHEATITTSDKLTLFNSVDASIAVQSEPMYFGAPLGGYFGGEATTIEASASVQPLNLSISMGKPTVSSTFIHTTANALLGSPLSIASSLGEISVTSAVVIGGTERGIEYSWTPDATQYSWEGCSDLEFYVGEEKPVSGIVSSNDPQDDFSILNAKYDYYDENRTIISSGPASVVNIPNSKDKRITKTIKTSKMGIQVVVLTCTIQPGDLSQPPQTRKFKEDITVSSPI